ncbi:MAG: butyrate kinase [Candidatus Aminicenantes bacterium]|nr:butyrate kinase [Candidatus Aminicenantes bacterium]
MSEKKHLILVINPGSTSTKIAVYKDKDSLFEEEVMHSNGELSKFPDIMSQQKFRGKLIENTLDKNGIRLEEIQGFVGRGGLMKPLSGGTYRVNGKMLKDLKNSVYGKHASNLGAVFAHEFASRVGAEAYIVDPVTVDEMEETARVSGIPEISRISIFHALSQKAVARLAAEDLDRRLEDLNLIVVHLGGGISIGAHRKGQVIDVNNAFNGDGPMAPTRSGGLPAWALVEWALSGKLSREEMNKKISSQGGLTAYLGTGDIREVKEMIKNGDQKAELIYQAMAYQVSKEIGACAAVLKGDVDAVVFTGGIARDQDFIRLVTDHIRFIAEIMVYPGSHEMEALALGVLRVLKGEEKSKEYAP